MSKAKVASIEGLYFADVGGVSLLDYAEEVKLAKEIERGCVNAKHTLIRANLRLVVSIAKSYRRRFPNIPLMDLIQEGNLGLFKAVKKFDWRKGYKFSTYATHCIGRTIQKAAGDQEKIVKVTGCMLKNISEYACAQNELFAKLGREARIAEIAFKLGWKVSKVDKVSRAAISILSLDSLVAGPHESEEAFSALLQESRKSSLAESEIPHLRDAIDQAFLELTERERTVLTLRFGLDGGEPQTLGEIGKKIGLTRERTRQVQNESLAKLQQTRAMSEYE